MPAQELIQNGLVVEGIGGVVVTWLQNWRFRKKRGKHLYCFTVLNYFVLLCFTLYYFVLGGGGRNNSWDGMLSPITSHYREKYSASKKWRPILNRISSG